MKPSQKSYAEKLKDPRWQRKRLLILERDKFTCRECGDSKNTLHVHHRYYVAGRNPWEYPGYCLLTLCLGCHKSATNERDDEGNFQVPEWELFPETFTEGGKTSDLFDLAADFHFLAQRWGLSHSEMCNRLHAAVKESLHMEREK